MTFKIILIDLFSKFKSINNIRTVLGLESLWIFLLVLKR